MWSICSLAGLRLKPSGLDERLQRRQSGFRVVFPTQCIVSCSNMRHCAATPSARSGLDSTTALQLVESLHSLAAGGRAIITTIHQPSRAACTGCWTSCMLLCRRAAAVLRQGEQIPPHLHSCSSPCAPAREVLGCFGY